MERVSLGPARTCHRTVLKPIAITCINIAATNQLMQTGEVIRNIRTIMHYSLKIVNSIGGRDFEDEDMRFLAKV